MSWKTAAALIITVGTLLAAGAFLGPVLTDVVYTIMGTGDYNGQYMSETMATGLVGTWFNTILIAVFGIIVASIVYVVRNEITRGGGL